RRGGVAGAVDGDWDADGDARARAVARDVDGNGDASRVRVDRGRVDGAHAHPAGGRRDGAVRDLGVDRVVDGVARAGAGAVEREGALALPALRDVGGAGEGES